MSREKRTSSPFFQLYLDGEVLADDIDDFIDQWHERPGRKKIFDFLGLTKEEYELWLRDPNALADIASARSKISSASDSRVRSPSYSGNK